MGQPVRIEITRAYREVWKGQREGKEKKSSSIYGYWYPYPLVYGEGGTFNDIFLFLQ